MYCESKAKVDRILSLNLRYYGNVQILFDKWILEAGRSKVLLINNVLWVLVSGIPLNLRSSDLFRQLGSVCGEFLGFEEPGSLSSVRIKIKPKVAVSQPWDMQKFVGLSLDRNDCLWLVSSSGPD
ncbi:hypothetical protein LINPERHAP1_LOCUS8597 [Linum perenne]